MIDFDNEWYEIGKVSNINIDKYTHDYYGMICKKTRLPDGFGRDIARNNHCFYDG